MQWIVVGTGALASLWAHGLITGGNEVKIFSRHPSDTPRVRLTIEADGRTQQSTFETVADETQVKPGSTWLIIVKAWQLADVINQIKPLVPAQARVILSHNGMGVAQNELAACPDWSVYDLVTTHGAWRKSRKHSVHAGFGQSWVGPREPALSVVPDWFAQLAPAMSPLAWDNDILLRRWRKLAINCAINPLATLAKVRNGILKNPHFQQDIRAICEEVATVAETHISAVRSQNHHSSDHATAPALFDADALEAEIYAVINATAHNRCSMLQDKEAGKQTEIDFLNGYICRLGQDYDIPTPVNQRLWQALI